MKIKITKILRRGVFFQGYRCISESSIIKIIIIIKIITIIIFVIFIMAKIVISFQYFVIIIFLI